MPRFVPLVALLLFSAALMNCGKGSSISQQPIPNIAGSWEFIANSSTPGSNAVGIEVALQEGQTLLNGIYTPSGQVSASTAQIVVPIPRNSSDSSERRHTWRFASLTAVNSLFAPNDILRL